MMLVCVCVWGGGATKGLNAVAPNRRDTPRARTRLHDRRPRGAEPQAEAREAVAPRAARRVALNESKRDTRPRPRRQRCKAAERRRAPERVVDHRLLGPRCGRRRGREGLGRRLAHGLRGARRLRRDACRERVARGRPRDLVAGHDCRRAAPAGGARVGEGRRGDWSRGMGGASNIAPSLIPLPVHAPAVGPVNPSVAGTA